MSRSDNFSDNPEEIMRQLKNLGVELHNEIENLKDKANKKAVAEAEYRKAFNIKIIELKSEGMSITLINDIAKGDEAIANLKVERDKFEALFQASRYTINALHDRISIGQSVLSWLKKEYSSVNITQEG